MAIQRRDLSEDWVSLTRPKQFMVRRARVCTFAADPTITQTNTTDEEIIAQVGAGAGQPGTTRGDTWPQLTPVWFDATNNLWRIIGIDSTGADEADPTPNIDGFLLGADGWDYTKQSENPNQGMLQLSATDEVMGVVLFAGDIFWDHIHIPSNVHLPYATTMYPHFRDGHLRSRDIHIHNDPEGLVH